MSERGLEPRGAVAGACVSSRGEGPGLMPNRGRKVKVCKKKHYSRKSQGRSRAHEAERTSALEGVGCERNVRPCTMTCERPERPARAPGLRPLRPAARSAGRRGERRQRRPRGHAHGKTNFLFPRFRSAMVAVEHRSPTRTVVVNAGWAYRPRSIVFPAVVNRVEPFFWTLICIFRSP